jgi:hypothetical protein
MQQKKLFNHLIGDREQLVRHVKSNCLCSLEVDYKLELSGQQYIRLQCDQLCRVRAHALGIARTPAGVDAQVAAVGPLSELLLY